MPTYEYKGHEFSSEKELTAAEWKQTLAYFDSLGEKKKEEEGYWSKLGNYLTPDENTGEALGAGFLNRALGLSRGLGGDVAESQTKSQLAADVLAQTNAGAVGAGGMAADTIAAFPALAVTGGAAAFGAPLATGISAMGLEGILAGGPVGLGRAGEQYQKVLDKTGDSDAAMKSALIEGAGGVVDFGLPASMGGNILKRAVGGAALNVPTSIAQTHAQNAVLPENMQQDPYDPIALTMNAAMGGAFGAMGAKANPFKPEVPSEAAPNPRKGTYIKEEPVPTDAPFEAAAQERRANISRTISELESDLQNLHSALARTKDEDKANGIKALMEQKQGQLEEHKALAAKLDGTEPVDIQPKDQVPLSAYDELQAPKEDAVDLKTALQTSKRNTRFGETDDPIASDILSSKNFKVLQDDLTNQGIIIYDLIGAGGSSIVFRTNKGALRLGVGDLVKTPKSDNILQAIQSKQIGTLRYELMPLAETKNVNNSHLSDVTQLLKQEGIDFTDAGLDNIGLLNGKPVVIDPGSVKQQKLNQQSYELDFDTGEKQIKDRGIRHGEFRNVDWHVASDATIKHNVAYKEDYTNRLEKQIKFMEDELKERPRDEHLRTQLENITHLHKVISDELSELQAIQKSRIIENDRGANTVNAIGKELQKNLPNNDSPTLHNALVTHVENGDLKGALTAVRDVSGNRNLSIIADALLKNPHLARKGIFGFNKDNVHGAQHDPRTENISFRTKDDVSAFTVIHEALHRITSNLLDRFKAGKLSDVGHKLAAGNIVKLYQRLITNGDLNTKLREAYIKNDNDAAFLNVLLKNETEFVSYGLTDPKFMAALDSVRVGGVSTFKKILDDASRLLGFNKEVRTAYTELLENSLHLAEKSDIPSGLGNITPNGVIDRQDPTSKKLGRLFTNAIDFLNVHTFTEQLGGIYKEFKGLQNLVASANTILEEKTGLIREALQGVSKKDFSIKRLSDDKSIAELSKILKPTEWLDVQNIFRDLYKNHLSSPEMQTMIRNNPSMVTKYEQEALDKAIAQLSPEQQQAAHALNKARLAIEKRGNDMYAAMGIDFKIPHKMFYYLITRQGKYGAVVKLNGVDIHLERFITQNERDTFVKRVYETAKKQGQENRVLVEDVVNEKADEDKFISLQEQLLYAQQRAYSRGESPEKMFDAMLNELEATNKSLGGHLEHRANLTGYAGTEWFMSKERQAERFLDQIENSVHEYAEQIARRALALKAAKIRDNFDMSERERNIFEQYFDHKMNATQSWAKPKTTDGATKHVEQTMSDSIRETIQDGFKTISPDGTKSDGFVFDTMIAGMNALTYMKHLTFAPIQMVAQFTGFTAGFRDLFNKEMNYRGTQLAEQNNPLKATASVGIAIYQLGKIATGNFDKLSPQVKRGLIQASQNTEVFQPHLGNEMLKQSKLTDIGRNTNEWFKKLSSGVTMSDSAGRLTLWLSYYNNLKSSGLKEKDLFDLINKLTTDNMLLVDKRNQALFIRKSGLVGQLISPMKSYGLGFTGNMVGDLRSIVKDPSVNNMLRLSATTLGAMIFGGAISAPLVAEYDLLCGLIGKPEAQISRKLIASSPDWATYGVFGSTGADLGSSARYHSIADFWDINKSIFENMAAVSTFGDVAGNAITLGKAAMGNATKHETREATMGVLPRGPIQAAADELFFDAGNREYTANAKGEMVAHRTTTDRIAFAFGGKSINERKERDIIQHITTEEKLTNDKITHALKLIADGNDNGFKKLEEIESGLTPKEMNSKIKTIIKNQNSTILERKLKGNTAAARRLMYRYGDLLNDR